MSDATSGVSATPTVETLAQDTVEIFGYEISVVQVEGAEAIFVALAALFAFMAMRQVAKLNRRSTEQSRREATIHTFAALRERWGDRLAAAEQIFEERRRSRVGALHQALDDTDAPEDLKNSLCANFADRKPLRADLLNKLAAETRREVENAVRLVPATDPFRAEDQPPYGKFGEETLRPLFDTVESLADAVLADVCDVDVLHRLSGPEILRVYKEHGHYVHYVRRMQNRERYRELEILVDRLLRVQRANRTYKSWRVCLALLTRCGAGGRRLLSRILTGRVDVTEFPGLDHFDWELDSARVRSNRTYLDRVARAHGPYCRSLGPRDEKAARRLVGQVCKSTEGAWPVGLAPDGKVTDRAVGEWLVRHSGISDKPGLHRNSHSLGIFDRIGWRRRQTLLGMVSVTKLGPPLKEQSSRWDQRFELIRKDSGPSALEPNIWRGHLERMGIPIEVAEESMSNPKHLAVIEHFMVRPESRSRGVGRLLLRHALSWIRNKWKDRTVLVEVIADHPAQEFGHALKLFQEEGGTYLGSYNADSSADGHRFHLYVF